MSGTPTCIPAFAPSATPTSSAGFKCTPIVTVGPYAYNPESDELLDARVHLEQAREELEATEAEIASHAPATEEEPTSAV